MPDISDRYSVEPRAQDLISKRLMPLVTLIDQVNSLFDRGINAIADHPQPGAAAKVGLMLTSRLANDIRVCSLTSYLGYGLQALGFSATVLEVVGALAFVGCSDSRAVGWAEHADPKRTYPGKVCEGIDATMAALGISDPAVKDNWKLAYMDMCTAKHANPRLSLIHGLRIDSSDPWFSCGPDCSDFGICLSAQALWYAVNFGAFGIHIALAHCSEETLQAQLRAEARSINEHSRGLEEWYLEVTSPNSSPEKQASALSAETERLRFETEQLQSETERLRHEAQRMNGETRQFSE